MATNPDMKPFFDKSSGIVGTISFSGDIDRNLLVVFIPAAQAVADAAESVIRLSSEWVNEIPE